MGKRLRCGLVLSLALAACSSHEQDQAANRASDAIAGETIACALDGSLKFAPTCSIERGQANGIQTIVVRRVDGGFRRLAVSADGQHLEAADGADVTQSARKGDRFEVILGQDRYVIPVKPADQPDARPS